MGRWSGGLCHLSLVDQQEGSAKPPTAPQTKIQFSLLLGGWLTLWQGKWKGTGKYQIASDASGQLHILTHDGAPFSMDRTRVGVFKETNQICPLAVQWELRTKTKNLRLAQLLPQLPHKPMKRHLAYQKNSDLLVTLDLQQGMSPSPVPMMPPCYLNIPAQGCSSQGGIPNTLWLLSCLPTEGCFVRSWAVTSRWAVTLTITAFMKEAVAWACASGPTDEMFALRSPLVPLTVYVLSLPHHYVYMVHPSACHGYEAHGKLPPLHKLRADALCRLLDTYYWLVTMFCLIAVPVWCLRWVKRNSTSIKDN